MTNQTINIAADDTGKELILRVPHPSTVHAGHQVVSPPFWQLVGRSLSLTILPPSGTFTFSAQVTGIKVLYGQVTLFDERNDLIETRGIAPSAKSVWSTLLAGRTHLMADAENGAVFLIIESIDGEWQGPFKARNQIISRNILPVQPHIHGSARKVDFSFVQVEELDWQPEGMWDKFLYYNARGFSVRFHGITSENLVHVQAWALGVGETTRFHNYSDKSFCEINYCLFNGKGAGGMAYLSDKFTDQIDPKKELTKAYVDQNSKRLVVPSMYEHGPLWKIEQGTKATPEVFDDDTVDYPWHAWLSSEFGDYKIPHQVRPGSSEQSFDIWMSFRFSPSAFQF